MTLMAKTNGPEVDEQSGPRVLLRSDSSGESIYRSSTKTLRESLLEWVGDWAKRYQGAILPLKPFVLLAFEIVVLAKAVVYGPFFTVRASLSLAADAWKDDGTRPDSEKTTEEKDNALNGIILTVAEALGESVPQLCLQTYFFVHQDQELDTIAVFASSLSLCVAGILYAIYNTAMNFREMLKRIGPPKMSPEELRRMGVSAEDALSQGYTTEELKAGGYTAEELDDVVDAPLKKLFRAYDADNSDSIDVAKLGPILESLLAIKPSESTLRDLIAEVDINNDGVLQLDEFLQLVSTGARCGDSRRRALTPAALSRAG